MKLGYTNYFTLLLKPTVETFKLETTSPSCTHLKFSAADIHTVAEGESLLEFSLKVCSIFYVLRFFGVSSRLLIKLGLRAVAVVGLDGKPIETLNRISGFTNKLGLTWVDRVKPQEI